MLRCNPCAVLVGSLANTVLARSQYEFEEWEAQSDGTFRRVYYPGCARLPPTPSNGADRTRALVAIRGGRASAHGMRFLVPATCPDLDSLHRRLPLHYMRQYQREMRRVDNTLLCTQGGGAGIRKKDLDC